MKHYHSSILIQNGIYGIENFQFHVDER